MGTCLVERRAFRQQNSEPPPTPENSLLVVQCGPFGRLAAGVRDGVQTPPLSCFPLGHGLWLGSTDNQRGSSHENDQTPNSPSLLEPALHLFCDSARSGRNRICPSWNPTTSSRGRGSSSSSRGRPRARCSARCGSSTGRRAGPASRRRHPKAQEEWRRRSDRFVSPRHHDFRPLGPACRS